MDCPRSMRTAGDRQPRESVVRARGHVGVGAFWHRRSANSSSESWANAWNDHAFPAPACTTCRTVRACSRSPSALRRELFACRPRKSEGVDVCPRLSDDAGLRANRPGPYGLPPMGRQAAARGLTPAFAGAGSARQAGAAPRTATWRPIGDNARYLEIANRLLQDQAPHGGLSAGLPGRRQGRGGDRGCGGQARQECGLPCGAGAGEGLKGRV
jgi:hypothetical protein